MVDIDAAISKFESDLIQFGKNNLINFQNIVRKKIDFNIKINAIGIRLFGKRRRLKHGMNGMFKQDQLAHLERLCCDFKTICKL